MWKSFTPKVVFTTLLMCALSPLTHAVVSAQSSAAERSFAKFAELANLNNPDIADLYADDARIEYIVMDGWKLKEALLLSGSDYKQRLAKDSKPSNDLFTAHSEFHEVDFFTNGPRIGFFAVRYSHQTCVTDDQYFVIFERGDDNQYRIVRERVETAPQNLCHLQQAQARQAANKGGANFNVAAQAFEEDNPFVAELTLEKLAKQLEANPPKQLDANTEFVGFIHKDSAITYSHRLINYQSNPKYDGLLKHVTKATLVRKTCHNNRLIQVLNYKGKIHYDYQDKAAQDIFDIQIHTQDCEKLAQAEARKRLQ